MLILFCFDTQCGVFVYTLNTFKTNKCQSPVNRCSAFFLSGLCCPLLAGLRNHMLLNCLNADVYSE